MKNIILSLLLLSSTCLFAGQIGTESVIDSTAVSLQTRIKPHKSSLKEKWQLAKTIRKMKKRIKEGNPLAAPVLIIGLLGVAATFIGLLILSNTLVVSLTFGIVMFWISIAALILTIIAAFLPKENKKKGDNGKIALAFIANLLALAGSILLVVGGAFSDFFNALFG
ncbi:MAG: hypothetical protein AAFY71_16385 [Bacteroidota bacterium]